MGGAKFRGVNSFEDPRKIDGQSSPHFETIVILRSTKEISKRYPTAVRDRYIRYVSVETMPPRFSHLADSYELAGSPIKY